MAMLDTVQERGPDRSDTTRRQLCLAAEELVAREGIGQATLRSIAAAAGQRNTAAVSYHFGSVENLLRAAVDMRVRDLEPHRRALIAERGGDVAALDPFAAWLCMMRPYLMLADERVPHAHARFLMHMCVAARLSDPIAPGYEAPDAPTMEMLLVRIAAGLSHLPHQQARARMSLCGMLYWNAIALFDGGALGSTGPTVPLGTILADVEDSVRRLLTKS